MDRPLVTGSSRRAFGWAAAMALLAFGVAGGPAASQVALPRPDPPPVVIPAPEPSPSPPAETPTPAPSGPPAVAPAPRPAPATPAPVAPAPAPDATPAPDVSARRSAARRAAERTRAARAREARRRERAAIALASSRQSVARRLSDASATLAVPPPTAVGDAAADRDGGTDRGTVVLLALLGLAGLSALLALAPLAWSGRGLSRSGTGPAARFLEDHRVEFVGISTAFLVVALLALAGLV